MKTGPFHDPSRDERWDGSDPLWNLLGRAPLPEPEGWFTARTLARCRREAARSGHNVLAGVLRWALGGGFSVAVAVVFFVAQVHVHKAEKQAKVQEAFQIVASIDTDSDSSASSSSWQDSSF